MKKPDKTYIIKFANNGDDGWAYGRPPGIETRQWPRSRMTGLPMAHLFTTRVPPEYQVCAPEIAFLSVFQADDHVADEVEGVYDFLDDEGPALDDDAFWASLEEYRDHMHPGEIYIEDEIGGGWCLLYLSQIEFSGEEPDLPGTDTTPKNLDIDDEDNGLTCFSSDEPAKRFTLEAHFDDPNTGIKPVDGLDWISELENKDGDNQDDLAKAEVNGYIPIFSPWGKKLNLDRYLYDNHFGGTSHAAQSIPEELSPIYIEFDATLGSPNIGGDGVAQIDLKSNKVFWAWSSNLLSLFANDGSDAF